MGDGGGVRSSWLMPDSCSSLCFECGVPFSTFVRRHHCSQCGLVFCCSCCSTFVDGAAVHLQGGLRVRLCRGCVELNHAHGLSPFQQRQQPQRRQRHLRQQVQSQQPQPEQAQQQQPRGQVQQQEKELQEQRGKHQQPQARLVASSRGVHTHRYTSLSAEGSLSSAALPPDFLPFAADGGMLQRNAAAAREGRHLMLLNSANVLAMPVDTGSTDAATGATPLDERQEPRADAGVSRKETWHLRNSSPRVEYRRTSAPSTGSGTGSSSDLLPLTDLRATYAAAHARGTSGGQQREVAASSSSFPSSATSGTPATLSTSARRSPATATRPALAAAPAAALLSDNSAAADITAATAGDSIVCVAASEENKTAMGDDTLFFDSSWCRPDAANAEPAGTSLKSLSCHQAACTSEPSCVVWSPSWVVQQELTRQRAKQQQQHCCQRQQQCPQKQQWHGQPQYQQQQQIQQQQKQQALLVEQKGLGQQQMAFCPSPQSRGASADACLTLSPLSKIVADDYSRSTPTGCTLSPFTTGSLNVFAATPATSPALVSTNLRPHATFLCSPSSSPVVVDSAPCDPSAAAMPSHLCASSAAAAAGTPFAPAASAALSAFHPGAKTLRSPPSSAACSGDAAARSLCCTSGGVFDAATVRATAPSGHGGRLRAADSLTASPPTTYLAGAAAGAAAAGAAAAGTATRSAAAGATASGTATRAAAAGAAAAGAAAAGAAAAGTATRSAAAGATASGTATRAAAAGAAALPSSSVAAAAAATVRVMSAATKTRPLPLLLPVGSAAERASRLLLESMRLHCQLVGLSPSLHAEVLFLLAVTVVRPLRLPPRPLRQELPYAADSSWESRAGAANSSGDSRFASVSPSSSPPSFASSSCPAVAATAGFYRVFDSIKIKRMQGGYITDSFYVHGVVFPTAVLQKSLHQLRLQRPRIVLLSFYLGLTRDRPKTLLSTAAGNPGGSGAGEKVSRILSSSGTNCKCAIFPYGSQRSSFSWGLVSKASSLLKGLLRFALSSNGTQLSIYYDAAAPVPVFPYPATAASSFSSCREVARLSPKACGALQGAAVRGRSSAAKPSNGHVCSVCRRSAGASGTTQEPSASFVAGTEVSCSTASQCFYSSDVEEEARATAEACTYNSEKNRGTARFVPLQLLREQEAKHADILVSKIRVLQPDLIISSCDASFLLQQQLKELNIAFLPNVRMGTLRRISRCTGAPILPSLDLAAATVAANAAATFASDSPWSAAAGLTSSPGPRAAAAAAATAAATTAAATETTTAMPPTAEAAREAATASVVVSGSPLSSPSAVFPVSPNWQNLAPPWGCCELFALCPSLSSTGVSADQQNASFSWWTTQSFGCDKVVSGRIRNTDEVTAADHHIPTWFDRRRGALERSAAESCGSVNQPEEPWPRIVGAANPSYALAFIVGCPPTRGATICLRGGGGEAANRRSSLQVYFNTDVCSLNCSDGCSRVPKQQQQPRQQQHPQVQQQQQRQRVSQQHNRQQQQPQQRQLQSRQELFDRETITTERAATSAARGVCTLDGEELLLAKRVLRRGLLVAFSLQQELRFVAASCTSFPENRHSKKRFAAGAAAATDRSDTAPSLRTASHSAVVTDSAVSDQAAASAPVTAAEAAEHAQNCVARAAADNWHLAGSDCSTELTETSHDKETPRCLQRSRDIHCCPFRRERSSSSASSVPSWRAGCCVNVEKGEELPVAGTYRGLQWGWSCTTAGSCCCSCTFSVRHDCCGGSPFRCSCCCHFVSRPLFAPYVAAAASAPAAADFAALSVSGLPAGDVLGAVAHSDAASFKPGTVDAAGGSAAEAARNVSSLLLAPPSRYVPPSTQRISPSSATSGEPTAAAAGGVSPEFVLQSLLKEKYLHVGLREWVQCALSSSTVQPPVLLLAYYLLTSAFPPGVEPPSDKKRASGGGAAATLLGRRVISPAAHSSQNLPYAQRHLAQQQQLQHQTGQQVQQQRLPHQQQQQQKEQWLQKDSRLHHKPPLPNNCEQQQWVPLEGTVEKPCRDTTGRVAFSQSTPVTVHPPNGKTDADAACVAASLEPSAQHPLDADLHAAKKNLCERRQVLSYLTAIEKNLQGGDFLNERDRAAATTDGISPSRWREPPYEATVADGTASLHDPSNAVGCGIRFACRLPPARRRRLPDARGAVATAGADVPVSDSVAAPAAAAAAALAAAAAVAAVARTDRAGVAASEARTKPPFSPASGLLQTGARAAAAAFETAAAAARAAIGKRRDHRCMRWAESAALRRSRTPEGLWAEVRAAERTAAIAATSSAASLRSAAPGSFAAGAARCATSSSASAGAAASLGASEVSSRVWNYGVAAAQAADPADFLSHPTAAAQQNSGEAFSEVADGALPPYVHRQLQKLLPQLLVGLYRLSAQRLHLLSSWSFNMQQCDAAPQRHELVLLQQPPQNNELLLIPSVEQLAVAYSTFKAKTFPVFPYSAAPLDDPLQASTASQSSGSDASKSSSNTGWSNSSNGGRPAISCVQPHLQQMSEIERQEQQHGALASRSRCDDSQASFVPSAISCSAAGAAAPAGATTGNVGVFCFPRISSCSVMTMESLRDAVRLRCAAAAAVASSRRCPAGSSRCRGFFLEHSLRMESLEARVIVSFSLLQAEDRQQLLAAGAAGVGSSWSSAGQVHYEAGLQSGHTNGNCCHARCGSNAGGVLNCFVEEEGADERDEQAYSCEDDVDKDVVMRQYCTICSRCVLPWKPLGAAGDIPFSKFIELMLTNDFYRGHTAAEACSNNGVADAFCRGAADAFFRGAIGSGAAVAAPPTASESAAALSACTAGTAGGRAAGDSASRDSAAAVAAAAFPFVTAVIANVENGASFVDGTAARRAFSLPAYSTRRDARIIFERRHVSDSVGAPAGAKHVDAEYFEMLPAVSCIHIDGSENSRAAVTASVESHVPTPFLFPDRDAAAGSRRRCFFGCVPAVELSRGAPKDCSSSSRSSGTNNRSSSGSRNSIRRGTSSSLSRTDCLSSNSRRTEVYGKGRSIGYSRDNNRKRLMRSEDTGVVRSSSLLSSAARGSDGDRSAAHRSATHIEMIRYERGGRLSCDIREECPGVQLPTGIAVNHYRGNLCTPNSVAKMATAAVAAVGVTARAPARAPATMAGVAEDSLSKASILQAASASPSVGAHCQPNEETRGRRGTTYTLTDAPPEATVNASDEMPTTNSAEDVACAPYSGKDQVLQWASDQDNGQAREGATLIVENYFFGTVSQQRREDEFSVPTVENFGCDAAPALADTRTAQQHHSRPMHQLQQLRRQHEDRASQKQHGQHSQQKQNLLMDQQMVEKQVLLAGQLHCQGKEQPRWNQEQRQREQRLGKKQDHRWRTQHQDRRTGEKKYQTQIYSGEKPHLPCLSYEALVASQETRGHEGPNVQAKISASNVEERLRFEAIKSTCIPQIGATLVHACSHGDSMGKQQEDNEKGGKRREVGQREGCVGGGGACAGGRKEICRAREEFCCSAAADDKNIAAASCGEMGDTLAVGSSRVERKQQERSKAFYAGSAGQSAHLRGKRNAGSRRSPAQHTVWGYCGRGFPRSNKEQRAPSPRSGAKEEREPPTAGSAFFDHGGQEELEGTVANALYEVHPGGRHRTAPTGDFCSCACGGSAVAACRRPGDTTAAAQCCDTGAEATGKLDLDTAANAVVHGETQRPQCAAHQHDEADNTRNNDNSGRGANSRSTTVQGTTGDDFNAIPEAPQPCRHLVFGERIFYFAHAGIVMSFHHEPVRIYSLQRQEGRPATAGGWSPSASGHHPPARVSEAAAAAFLHHGGNVQPGVYASFEEQRPAQLPRTCGNCRLETNEKGRSALLVPPPGLGLKAEGGDTSTKQAASGPSREKVESVYLRRKREQQKLHGSEEDRGEATGREEKKAQLVSPETSSEWGGVEGRSSRSTAAMNWSSPITQPEKQQQHQQSQQHRCTDHSLKTEQKRLQYVHGHNWKDQLHRQEDEKLLQQEQGQRQKLQLETETVRHREQQFLLDGLNCEAEKQQDKDHQPQQNHPLQSVGERPFAPNVGLSATSVAQPGRQVSPSSRPTTRQTVPHIVADAVSGKKIEENKYLQEGSASPPVTRTSSVDVERLSQIVCGCLSSAAEQQQQGDPRPKNFYDAAVSTCAEEDLMPLMKALVALLLDAVLLPQLPSVTTVSGDTSVVLDYRRTRSARRLPSAKQRECTACKPVFCHQRVYQAKRSKDAFLAPSHTEQPSPCAEHKHRSPAGCSTLRTKASPVGTECAPWALCREDRQRQASHAAYEGDKLGSAREAAKPTSSVNVAGIAGSTASEPSLQDPLPMSNLSVDADTVRDRRGQWPWEADAGATALGRTHAPTSACPEFLDRRMSADSQFLCRDASCVYPPRHQCTSRFLHCSPACCASAALPHHAQHQPMRGEAHSQEEMPGAPDQLAKEKEEKNKEGTTQTFLSGCSPPAALVTRLTPPFCVMCLLGWLLRSKSLRPAQRYALQCARHVAAAALPGAAKSAVQTCNRNSVAAGRRQDDPPDDLSTTFRPSTATLAGLKRNLFVAVNVFSALETVLHDVAAFFFSLFVFTADALWSTSPSLREAFFRGPLCTQPACTATMRASSASNAPASGFCTPAAGVGAGSPDRAGTAGRAGGGQRERQAHFSAPECREPSDNESSTAVSSNARRSLHPPLREAGIKDNPIRWLRVAQSFVLLQRRLAAHRQLLCERAVALLLLRYCMDVNVNSCFTLKQTRQSRATSVAGTSSPRSSTGGPLPKEGKEHSETGTDAVVAALDAAAAAAAVSSGIRMTTTEAGLPAVGGWRNGAELDVTGATVCAATAVVPSVPESSVTWKQLAEQGRNGDSGTLACSITLTAPAAGAAPRSPGRCSSNSNNRCTNDYPGVEAAHSAASEDTCTRCRNYNLEEVGCEADPQGEACQILRRGLLVACSAVEAELASLWTDLKLREGDPALQQQERQKIKQKDNGEKICYTVPSQTSSCKPRAKTPATSVPALRCTDAWYKRKFRVTVAPPVVNIDSPKAGCTLCKHILSRASGRPPRQLRLVEAEIWACARFLSKNTFPFNMPVASPTSRLVALLAKKRLCGQRKYVAGHSPVGPLRQRNICCSGVRSKMAAPHVRVRRLQPPRTRPYLTWPATTLSECFPMYSVACSAQRRQHSSRVGYCAPRLFTTLFTASPKGSQPLLSDKDVIGRVYLASGGACSFVAIDSKLNPVPKKWRDPQAMCLLQPQEQSVGRPGRLSAERTADRGARTLDSQEPNSMQQMGMQRRVMTWCCPSSGGRYCPGGFFSPGRPHLRGLRERHRCRRCSTSFPTSCPSSRQDGVVNMARAAGDACPEEKGPPSADEVCATAAEARDLGRTISRALSPEFLERKGGGQRLPNNQRRHASWPTRLRTTGGRFFHSRSRDAAHALAYCLFAGRNHSVVFRAASSRLVHTKVAGLSVTGRASSGNKRAQKLTAALPSRLLHLVWLKRPLPRNPALKLLQKRQRRVVVTCSERTAVYHVGRCIFSEQHIHTQTERRVRARPFLQVRTCSSGRRALASGSARTLQRRSLQQRQQLWLEAVHVTTCREKKQRVQREWVVLSRLMPPGQSKSEVTSFWYPTPRGRRLSLWREDSCSKNHKKKGAAAKLRCQDDRSVATSGALQRGTLGPSDKKKGNTCTRRLRLCEGRSLCNEGSFGVNTEHMHVLCGEHVSAWNLVRDFHGSFPRITSSHRDKCNRGRHRKRLQRRHSSLSETLTARVYSKLTKDSEDTLETKQGTEKPVLIGQPFQQREEPLMLRTAKFAPNLAKRLTKIWMPQLLRGGKREQQLGITQQKTWQEAACRRQRRRLQAHDAVGVAKQDVFQEVQQPLSPTDVECLFGQPLQQDAFSIEHTVQHNWQQPIMLITNSRLYGLRKEPLIRISFPSSGAIYAPSNRLAKQHELALKVTAGARTLAHLVRTNLVPTAVQYISTQPAKLLAEVPQQQPTLLLQKPRQSAEKQQPAPNRGCCNGGTGRGHVCDVVQPCCVPRTAQFCPSPRKLKAGKDGYSAVAEREDDPGSVIASALLSASMRQELGKLWKVRPAHRLKICFPFGRENALSTAFETRGSSKITANPPAGDTTVDSKSSADSRSLIESSCHSGGLSLCCSEARLNRRSLQQLTGPSSIAASVTCRNSYTALEASTSGYFEGGGGVLREKGTKESKYSSRSGSSPPVLSLRLGHFVGLPRFQQICQHGYLFGNCGPCTVIDSLQRLLLHIEQGQRANLPCSQNDLLRNPSWPTEKVKKQKSKDTRSVSQRRRHQGLYQAHWKSPSVQRPTVLVPSFVPRTRGDFNGENNFPRRRFVSTGNQCGFQLRQERRVVPHRQNSQIRWNQTQNVEPTVTEDTNATIIQPPKEGTAALFSRLCGRRFPVGTRLCLCTQQDYTFLELLSCAVCFVGVCPPAESTAPAGGTSARVSEVGILFGEAFSLRVEPLKGADPRITFVDSDNAVATLAIHGLAAARATGRAACGSAHTISTSASAASPLIRTRSSRRHSTSKSADESLTERGCRWIRSDVSGTFPSLLHKAGTRRHARFTATPTEYFTRQRRTHCDFEAPRGKRRGETNHDCATESETNITGSQRKAFLSCWGGAGRARQLTHLTGESRQCQELSLHTTSSIINGPSLCSPPLRSRVSTLLKTLGFTEEQRAWCNFGNRNCCCCVPALNDASDNTSTRTTAVPCSAQCAERIVDDGRYNEASHHSSVLFPACGSPFQQRRLESSKFEKVQRTREEQQLVKLFLAGKTFRGERDLDAVFKSTKDGVTEEFDPAAEHLEITVPLRSKTAPRAAGLTNADAPCECVVTVYYALRFHILRRLLCGDDDDFCHSLCHSSPVRLHGGKSGARFTITADSRYILKQLNRHEVRLLLSPRHGVAFFRHFAEVLLETKPTTLTCFYGMYQIISRAGGKEAGRPRRQFYVIMRNLRHAEPAVSSPLRVRGPRRLRIFDLKGMGVHRYIDAVRPPCQRTKAPEGESSHSDARTESDDFLLGTPDAFDARTFPSAEGLHTHNPVGPKPSRERLRGDGYGFRRRDRVRAPVSVLFPTVARVVATDVNQKITTVREAVNKAEKCTDFQVTGSLPRKPIFATAEERYFCHAFAVRRHRQQSLCRSCSANCDEQPDATVQMRGSDRASRGAGMSQSSNTPKKRCQCKWTAGAGVDGNRESVYCRSRTWMAREGDPELCNDGDGGTPACALKDRRMLQKLVVKSLHCCDDAGNRRQYEGTKSEHSGSRNNCAKEQTSERPFAALQKSTCWSREIGVLQSLPASSADPRLPVVPKVLASRSSLHLHSSTRRWTSEEHARLCATSARSLIACTSVKALTAPLDAGSCHVASVESAPLPVLWDQNFREFGRGFPLCMEATDHLRFRAALQDDTMLLEQLGVVDYSLLVLIDEETGSSSPVRQLAVGLIDFFRPYTWDKQVENIGKSLAYLTRGLRQRPTVLSPADYRQRFLRSMKAFFCSAYPSDYSTLTCYFFSILTQSTTRSALTSGESESLIDCLTSQAGVTRDEQHVQGAPETCKTQSTGCCVIPVARSQNQVENLAYELAGLCRPYLLHRNEVTRMSERGGQAAVPDTIIAANGKSCSHLYIKRDAECSCKSAGHENHMPLSYHSAERTHVERVQIRLARTCPFDADEIASLAEMAGIASVKRLAARAESVNADNTAVGPKYACLHNMKAHFAMTCRVSPAETVVMGEGTHLESALACRVRPDETTVVGEETGVVSAKTHSVKARLLEAGVSAVRRPQWTAVPHVTVHSYDVACNHVGRRRRATAEVTSPGAGTEAALVAARLCLLKLRVRMQEGRERELDTQNFVHFFVPSLM